MHTLLEYINSGGSVFVEFAWGMLVQSSILIVAVLLIDLLIRKRVRAVFRYWVWMLVLVKLVLPPSLASPVSVGYFVGDSLPTISEKQPALAEQNFEKQKVVKSEIEFPAGPSLSQELDASGNQARSAEWPRLFAEVEVEPIAAKSGTQEVQPAGAVSLSWEGAVFAGWMLVVGVMCLLVLQRVFFVLSLIRQAKGGNDLMMENLEYCRKRLNLKTKVRLKVSPNATSPAVCGLFRPVILVPHNLTPDLGTSQLRTVLLHELAHIKRGDLWANLVQTFLQIVYFYNPLLWLASAVIRRIREQAVDETVQAAMGEKARDYPETLLNVARLAFKRPALLLRLIGVVESRSALKARIKRMLTRPIPKSAKLGIAGLILVVVIGGLLLPMAKAERQSGPTVAERVTLPYSVWMADIGIDDVMKILDLASGEIVQLSGFKKGADFIERVNSTSKGDVYVSYRKDANKPLIAFLKSAALEDEAATNENVITSPQIMEIPWETTVTTRKGHKYQFSLLSFDEKKCVIEYKLLNRAAKKAIAKAGHVKSNDKFTATLSNGVTVELVGLGTAPWESEQQWWRPDGVKTDKPEFKANDPPLKWPIDPNRLQFECAALVKFFNHSGKDISVPEVNLKNRILGIGLVSVIADDGSQMTYIVSNPFEGEVPNKADISLAVGTGPFKKAKTPSKKLNADQHDFYSLEDGLLIIRHPLRMNSMGTPSVDLTCPKKDFEFRLSAKLKTGETETWHGGSIGKEVKFFESTPKRENTKIEDIEELIIEYRPYEWVTFNNVSLKPGFKTNVQIEIENNMIKDSNNQLEIIRDILEKVESKYTSMKTYHAKGKTVSEISMRSETEEGLSRPHRIRSQFSINLSRDGKYCIEWSQNVHSAFTNTGAAWSVGSEDWLLLLGNKERMENRSMTLGAATGVSNGATATIPSLFFGEQIPLFNNLKFGPYEEINGEDCYVISGSINEFIYTYWISKERYLIHQVRWSSQNVQLPEDIDTDIHPETGSLRPEKFVITQTFDVIVINETISDEQFVPQNLKEAVREPSKNIEVEKTGEPVSGGAGEGKGLSFGPVVEIIINDNVSVGNNSNIDFDTGKLFPRPENWPQFSDDDWQQWIKKTGVDASGATRQTVKGLMCEGMIISPANNSWWEETPAHALATMDLWEKGKPGIPAYMTAQGQLPATYIFKTHEGGIGILQILGFKEDPSGGVKIRYKMVQNPGERVSGGAGEIEGEDVKVHPSVN
jgi:beta-lactamase regulating signal transducer with metallopeptidase domain